MQEKSGSKKKIVIIISIILAAIAAAVLIFIFTKKIIDEKSPTITIETPQKMKANDTEEFSLDVSINTLGEELYPAASVSISFDSSRLEFLGVTEGNVFVLNNESTSKQKLPEWSYNVDKCNETGKINIMYLDVTGGTHAFSKNLLAEEDNVLLRLNFKLRGSVRAGDVIDLTFDDAVFAASVEEQSLATAKDTLRAKNSKIVLGSK